MAVTPWKTTDELVAMVKRKISFPTSQATFSDQDVIDFLNEEMFIGQVPSVLTYHQEYFVMKTDVTLVANQLNYPIPNRAIGLRLRDIFYKDQNGNLYEMVRINPEDKAWFQRDFNNGGQTYQYYLENNNIVLPTNNIPNPVGSMQVSFFMRPNQLVPNANAAIITDFSQTITVDNSQLVVGDTVVFTYADQTTVTFTLVASSPGPYEFVLGFSDAITAGNLVTVINTQNAGLASGSVGVVTVLMDNVQTTITSTSLGFVIPDTQGVVFSSIPTEITDLLDIDFLQTLPGHVILGYDREIPTGGVAGTTINFTSGDVPATLIIGDYVCLSNEAIIPMIPPDLHNVLAERAASRILAAIGDVEGLQVIDAKIKEMAGAQGTLLDSRVDGSPQKVNNHHSLLHYGSRRVIRRF